MRPEATQLQAATNDIAFTSVEDTAEMAATPFAALWLTELRGRSDGTLDQPGWLRKT